jgi:hypothetical protein
VRQLTFALILVYTWALSMFVDSPQLLDVQRGSLLYLALVLPAVLLVLINVDVFFARHFDRSTMALVLFAAGVTAVSVVRFDPATVISILPLCATLIVIRKRQVDALAIADQWPVHCVRRLYSVDANIRLNTLRRDSRLFRGRRMAGIPVSVQRYAELAVRTDRAFCELLSKSQSGDSMGDDAGGALLHRTQCFADVAHRDCDGSGVPGAYAGHRAT